MDFAKIQTVNQQSHGLGGAVQITPQRLMPLVEKAEGFQEVLHSLQSGNSGTIDGTWGSSCALIAATLAQHCKGTVVILLPRISEVDDFAMDLRTFLGGAVAPPVFPAWESLPSEQRTSDTIFGGRLRCLELLESSKIPKCIVTSMPALVQPVPSHQVRKDSRKKLVVGEDLDLEEFSDWLVQRGFERVTAIEVPGEFSIHGGILDLFPTDALDPLRIELFGDEIESIRQFDVETQRRIADLPATTVTVLSSARKKHTFDSEKSNFENANSVTTPVPGTEPTGHFVDSLPPGSWIVLAELQDLITEGKHYLQRLEHPKGFFHVDTIMQKLVQFPTVTVAAIGGDSFDTTCHLKTQSVERFTGPKQKVLEELAEVISREEKVLLCCHNEGEKTRLSQLISAASDELQDSISLCIGWITRGFRLMGAGESIFVISDHELFGRQAVLRDSPRRRFESRAIDSFLELSEGDLVVHLTHGIGRYRGMQMVQKNGYEEEHLAIEFAEGMKVYVPVTLINLVQKYIGGSKTAPTLSKIGTTSWSKKKQKVSEAIQDMASDMIELQAQRASKPGISCPVDGEWQTEFEDSFPYDETPDQLSAMKSVQTDMQSPRPMDRLICGDVGYGKTEVAIRATFRAINSGRQVVILVPTTVLAEQHYRTFSNRLAEYPFKVATLSRFVSKKEQKEVLEGLASGEIDVVVGTHRLVQPDVKLKDLGLLIIDEEQRFGVDAKEMLKRMRLEVDVLTLSATPIPRTLHMSLLGVRDISNLQTPPIDRQAIETRIGRFDRELIRQAIVRELNRNGQIYFVHNRVYNIKTIADKIQSIVPEARIGIIHGQMGEHDLEYGLYQFVRGQTDILVATTIIESGLDIPNANTIFIHQADQYGLADLHQLRGRVGRYKHRAYCYLLVEEGKSLTSTAARRLRAIEEFSELGAGFKISMRDLEIRGAGNILGTEQSGHIAVVGYELYCQLLEQAVKKLKNEPLKSPPQVHVDLPVSAYLPGSYIPPGRQKIEIYRKFSSVSTNEELNDLIFEIRDRYGAPPPAVDMLIELKQLQIAAWNWQIETIRISDGFVVFGYRDKALVDKLAKKQRKIRVVDSQEACYDLPRNIPPTAELIRTLKSLLQ